MKIVAVCGMGFGSSLMLKMNIQSVLKELKVANVQVEHCDLNSIAAEKPDLIVVARDLEASCKKFGRVLVLSNIMNKTELKEKLQTVLASDASA